MRRLTSVGVMTEHGLVAAGVDGLLGGQGDEVVFRGMFSPSRASTIGDVDFLLVDVSGISAVVEDVVLSVSRNPAVGAWALFGDGLRPGLLRWAERHGAAAPISRSVTAEGLLVAARAAVAGERPPVRAASAAPRVALRAVDAGLSERELQVLALCADGLSNREIADALYLNIETVKSHLKRLYQRLGLRNRAEATAYVHRGAIGGAPVAELELVGPMPIRDTEGASADHLALDPAGLRDRLQLMGVTAESRGLLAPFATRVQERAAASAEGLIARWLANPATAPALRDPAVRQRLAVQQAGYARALFADNYDDRHVAAMLRIGAIHHRIRISPEWFVVSLAHVVCDQLPMIWEGCSTDEEAVEVVVALVASTLFDASAVLDAYELSVGRQLVGTAAEAPVASTAPPPEPVSTPPGAATPVRSTARMPTVSDEPQPRREFLELDEPTIERLRAMSPVVEAALPEVIDRFYAVLGSVDGFAELLHADGGARLKPRLAAHWAAMLSSGLDRAHARASVRVGVIHERIGLIPQQYLAGLSLQVAGILRALPRPGAAVRDEVDAFLRAVFLDVSFVLDAYLEARADALAQIGLFAGQLVSGLACGVVIVDRRDRVDYANDELLELVRIPASVLHRLPIASAVPFGNIEALVARARTEPEGRVSALCEWTGRELRATAMALRRSISGRDGLVAVIFDDVTDIVRASRRAGEDGRRFATLLATLSVVVWELDGETLEVLAISSGATAVLGGRDLDLLGRAAFVDRVHPDDRNTFVAICRGVTSAARVEFEHRVLHTDGTARTVRTSVLGSCASDSGTIFGVTTPV